MLSKLCPLSLAPHADVHRFLEAGCPMVKLVGDFALAADLVAVRPNLLLVGRVPAVYDVSLAAQSGQTPEAAARAFVNSQSAEYRRAPAIRVWEGPTEPVFGPAEAPTDMQQMAWYAEFEAERLRVLAELGLRGVVGNFASGTPDFKLWLAFSPALHTALEQHGYLGLHEYSDPLVWSDATEHILRYRRIYADYLQPAGYGQLPLLITASGVREWKTLIPVWRMLDGADDPVDYWRGPEKNPERYYAEQLAWYDRELQQDPYVVGAALAVVGQTDPAWAPFDIADTRVAQLVTAYMSGRGLGTPASPQPAARPGPAAVNLLVNSGFEQGQAYFQDDTRERAVPAGWRLTFNGETSPLLADQTAPFGRPFTALITRSAVAGADRARIFSGGEWGWKIAGAGTPVWVQLAQPVSQLRPGQTYRFTVRLLPDLITAAQLPPLYAADPRASEVRLAAQCGEQVYESGWLDGQTTPFGQYTCLTLDFTAAAPQAEVSVSVRGRWAWPLAAWYIAELSLTPTPL